MVDCHVHMVLDAVDWKMAVARHVPQVDEGYVRRVLDAWRNAGFTYLRDGGDKWGVSAFARKLAPEYGIVYRTPLAPISKLGHYGGFIGEQFGDMRQYAQMVALRRQQGADFIKIMISGLMDFHRFGVLTGEGLPAGEIREMVHIAHEEGFSVMAHANGARVMEAAAAAGVDSVEHGAYADGDALAAMAENDVIWVPTLSTVGNLLGAVGANDHIGPGGCGHPPLQACNDNRGGSDATAACGGKKGAERVAAVGGRRWRSRQGERREPQQTEDAAPYRGGAEGDGRPEIATGASALAMTTKGEAFGRFDRGAVREILDCAKENVCRFAGLGGLAASGSDAGAWAVPHAACTEDGLLRCAGVSDAVLETGAKAVMERF